MTGLSLFFIQHNLLLLYLAQPTVLAKEPTNACKSRKGCLLTSTSFKNCYVVFFAVEQFVQSELKCLTSLPLYLIEQSHVVECDIRVYRRVLVDLHGNLSLLQMLPSCQCGCFSTYRPFFQGFWYFKQILPHRTSSSHNTF